MRKPDDISGEFIPSCYLVRSGGQTQVGIPPSTEPSHWSYIKHNFIYRTEILREIHKEGYRVKIKERGNNKVVITIVHTHI